MTKTKLIMSLFEDGGRTMQEIARIVGCSDAYVRVVTRQRRGIGPSEADKRYWTRLHQNGDHEQSRAKARRAYMAAREIGRSPREASNVATVAYQRSMRETASGDRS